MTPNQTESEDFAVEAFRKAVQAAREGRVHGTIGVYVTMKDGKILDVCERSDYAHPRTTHSKR